MKHPYNPRAPSFDARAIQDTIERALSAAGLDTTAGPMHGVTETIRRALAAGALAGAGPEHETGTVIDVESRVVPAAPEPADRRGAGGPAPQRPGRFERHSFSNGAGTRAYKVHVPAERADPGTAARAMIVMLHGCTQSADDFAAGTQMNRLADEQGFVVVYPEQPPGANASKCWNWFNPQHQVRDAGEPSLIAGIVREVAQRQGVDPRRIYVAGLSAGAAMAVVLGRTYPELFAGVGVHSGLPYGSAHDVPSAMAAMKGRHAHNGAGGSGRQAGPCVPVIVFHGDRDHTVQASNGAQVVQQALQVHAGTPGSAPLQEQSHTGVAAGGRRYTRSVHVDPQGRTRVESWTLHGAGHAWSGGHASGSFTDGKGPDASAEMVRFFLAAGLQG